MFIIYSTNKNNYLTFNEFLKEADEKEWYTIEFTDNISKIREKDDFIAWIISYYGILHFKPFFELFTYLNGMSLIQLKKLAGWLQNYNISYEDIFLFQTEDIQLFEVGSFYDLANLFVNNRAYEGFWRIIPDELVPLINLEKVARELQASGDYYLTMWGFIITTYN